MVACTRHRDAKYRTPLLPRRLLQRQHTVTIALLSAFLDCSKVAKYDDLRAHIDRGRPLSKGLKRAIGQADQLLQQLQLAQSEGEPAPAPVEVPGPN